MPILGVFSDYLLKNRHFTSNPIVSVIAFHEKAGRSQVDSFLSDKVFVFATVATLPSALLNERFFARCKLGVLVSAGAATCLSTSVPPTGWKLGQAINAVTGTRRLAFVFPFPAGQFDPPLPATGAAEVSTEPIIGTDGNLYVMERGQNMSYNYSFCHVTEILSSSGQPTGTYEIDAMDGQLVYSANVAVAKITPDGSVQHIPVGTVSWSGEAAFQNPFGGPLINWVYDNGRSQLPQAFFRRIAPDGKGGLLFAWGGSSSTLNSPQQFYLSRIQDGSTLYTVPLPVDSDIATNLQGTAFFPDMSSRTVTAVDVATGGAKWTVNAFGFLAATEDGGAIVVSDPGAEEIDETGTVADVAPGVYPDAYLDPGLYGSLSRDFGELVVLQTAQTRRISNGFSVPQRGHTANRIGPLSPASFSPKADCSGFDGDDPHGLLRGALMVPAGGSNGLLLRNTSESVLLVPRDPTLIGSISPTFFTPDQTNVAITVTAAAGKSGGTWIDFVTLNPSKPIGKAFYVVIYPKINKSVEYFKVVAPASGSFAELAPDDSWMPTQSNLESELNRIFEVQANMHFNVSGPIVLNSAYDSFPQNGVLDNPGPVVSLTDPKLKELKRIESDAAGYTGFDVKAFFVRSTCNQPTRPAAIGFAYGPDSITRGFPPDVFIAEFGTNDVNCTIPATPNNLFPSNTTAHELGHHFGLYPKTADHHYPEDNVFQLMNKHSDYISETFGSGRCEINFFEWEQLHGNPNIRAVTR